MQQNWKGLAGPGTVGLEVVLSIALGLFGGAWLDEKLSTTPWLTVIGLAYGVAAAGRAIYRALKRANRELEDLERKEREERKKFDDD
ncbi:MAG: AtpZ/AtpI family protein [Pseudomonadota bacterium]|nr:MAG: ATP synthase subunit [Pseudomonadota bacterium]